MTKIEHKFKYNWGGEDTYFTKLNRWAENQKNPIIRHLVLGFLQWLWEHWVDGRVDMEMASIDKQAEDIVQEWESQDPKPTVKSSPSEVEGLDIISISTLNRNDNS